MYYRKNGNIVRDVHIPDIDEIVNKPDTKVDTKGDSDKFPIWALILIILLLVIIGSFLIWLIWR